MAQRLQRSSLELEHAVDARRERRAEAELAVALEPPYGVGGQGAGGGVVGAVDGAPVPPLLVLQRVGPVEEAQHLHRAREGYRVLHAVLHQVQRLPREDFTVGRGDVVLGVEHVGERYVLVPAVGAGGVLAPQGVDGDGRERYGGQLDVHHTRLHIVALARRGREVEVGAQLGRVADARRGGAVEVVVAVRGVLVVVAALQVHVGREAAVGVGLGVLVVLPGELEVGILVVGVVVAVDALLGDAVAGVERALVLVALVVVGLGLGGPREVGVDVAQQREVPVVAQGEVVAALLEVVAAVVLPSVGGDEHARGAALGDGEEGEGQRHRRRHILYREPCRAGHNLVAGDELALGEVDGEVGVGVVAGGVAAAAEVHHRVVHLLHPLPVQEPLALLGDDAIDDAFFGDVVESQRVGVVVGAVLAEEGAPHGVAGRVGGAVGMQGVGLEVHLHAVGLQQHAVVVNAAIAVEVGAAALEVHRHRVLRLVFHHLVHAVFRHRHQRVDIHLAPSPRAQRQQQGKHYELQRFQPLFTTLFPPFDFSSYLCIFDLQR